MSTPTLDQRPPETEDPIERRIRLESKKADRLFALSFIPAIVILLLLALWLGVSDIYGRLRTQQIYKRVAFKVYKPPVRVKPHPKPPPPPPPPKKQPPPPKVPPKVVHRTTPPPRPVPHNVPPPLGPRVTNPVAPAIPVAPEPTTPAEPAQPSNPQAPVNVQPTPPTPTPPPPVVEQPKPTPPPPVVEKPKPTPPPPVVEKPKPPNWQPVASQEPGEVSVPQPDLPSDLDPSTLSSTTVVISYTIDEHGKATSVRVKQSCGNHDLDQRCIDAVRRGKYLPAIQDHIPHETEGMTHEFSFGQ